jgi:hypothetical protein
MRRISKKRRALRQNCSIISIHNLHSGTNGTDVLLEAFEEASIV